MKLIKFDSILPNTEYEADPVRLLDKVERIRELGGLSCPLQVEAIDYPDAVHQAYQLLSGIEAYLALILIKTAHPTEWHDIVPCGYVPVIVRR